MNKWQSSTHSADLHNRRVDIVVDVKCDKLRTQESITPNIRQFKDITTKLTDQIIYFTGYNWPCILQASHYLSSLIFHVVLCKVYGYDHHIDLFGFVGQFKRAIMYKASLLGKSSKIVERLLKRSFLEMYSLVLYMRTGVCPLRVTQGLFISSSIHRLSVYICL